LLAIFLLALMPVYAIGMSIHSWGLSMVRRSVEERSLAQLEVYIGGFESDLTRLIMLQVDMLAGIELAWLSNMNSVMSGYERGKAVNDLQKRLLYLSSASAYSVAATARIQSLGMAVESAGQVRALTEKDRMFLQAAAPRTGLHIYGGDDLYTSTTFRIRDNEALYNVTVQLSQERIAHELEQLNASGGVGMAIFDGGALTVGTGVPEAWDRGEVAGQLLSRLAADGRQSGLADIEVGGVPYLLLYSRCDKFGLAACNLISASALYEPASSFATMLWMFLIAGIAVLLLFAVFVRRSIHRPMQLLVDAFRQMESGSTSPVAINYSGNDEYGYLFEQFNHMLGTLGELIERSYRQDIMLRDAELKHLQAQINPHFLYNSYFLLHRMIQRQDNERASQFSSYLGEYLRYVTRNAASQAPLPQEVGHARTYARIQALRFDGRIEVEFGELPQGFSERRAPRLILQPLVENAFGHGLRNKRSGGLLRVSFCAAGPCELHALVEDNGDELGDSDIGRLAELCGGRRDGAEYTALLNIHHRLRLQHGERSGLSFSRSELGGLCVRLAIVFREG
jgi:two-component system sensor histidine kinase YesM